MKSSNDPSTIRDDVAAIARDCDCGSQAALLRLYDITAPRLLRYAETLTQHRADAEDAMQSALMRIAASPHRLAQADQPWPYLLQTVRNESLRIIQKRRRTLSLARILQSWRPAVSALEFEESRQQVQHAIRNLPPDQAEVVVLKVWEGFTFAEIAELVSESPNTVASRYRYALQKLAQSLRGLSDLVLDSDGGRTVAVEASDGMFSTEAEERHV